MFVYRRKGNVKKSSATGIAMPALCSTDKINLAYRSGAIDEHQRILHCINSLSGGSALPDEFRSDEPLKSGTGTVEEIQRYLGRKDTKPEVAQAARQFLDSFVPKLDKVYKSPSGYFRIHYAVTGEHAVDSRSRPRSSVPPYIVKIGEAFDRSKAVTCGTRGFREPVLDEGQSTFDVHVFNLKGNYGITFSNRIYSLGTAKIRVASSYICIDNNYSSKKGFGKSRDDCMKVTAAHEFFHAVQYAYNADADKWWKEASATWNEDEVYKGVNDYVRYIKNFYSSPQRSLEESDYGGVVFVKFLSENYGGYELVRKIWEIQSTGGSASINAIEKAVRSGFAAQDIGTLFNRFSAYNFCPSQYYKDGAVWNVSASVQQTYASYPVAQSTVRLDHLAASYYLFKASDIPGGKSLKIFAEGQDKARWGFKLLQKYPGDKLYHLADISLSDSRSRGEILLQNFSATYEEVCFIPANLEKSRDGLSYVYSASLTEG